MGFKDGKPHYFRSSRAAQALIARFGTFAEAMNAPDELLREFPGIGEAAVGELKLVRAAALRLMRGEVLERNLALRRLRWRVRRLQRRGHEPLGAPALGPKPARLSLEG